MMWSASTDASVPGVVQSSSRPHGWCVPSWLNHPGQWVSPSRLALSSTRLRLRMCLVVAVREVAMLATVWWWFSIPGSVFQGRAYSVFTCPRYVLGRVKKMSEAPVLDFESHVDGKNARVMVFSDRVEW